MDLRIGHWTGNGTGVTVVVPPPGTIASGEVRGGAPATREFALLDPTRLVDRVDAVVLSGGSALGLAAGDGVARALWEQGRGFATPAGPVPIVIGMSIFDASVATTPPTAESGRLALAAALSPDIPTGHVGAGTDTPPGIAIPASHASAGNDIPTGRASARTDVPTGRASARTDVPTGHASARTDIPTGHASARTDIPTGHAAAGNDGPAGRTDAGAEIPTGRVGAGTGATVGKWRGSLSPGGIGIARATADGASLLALAVVNAWGDVIAPSGEVLNHPTAPPRTPHSPFAGTNTTIAVVATDARLSKTDCFLLAQSGHTGYARALHPAHSRYDGDAVVALATGTTDANLDLLRAAAADLTAEAIRRAITPPTS
ncbi:hypothetical protein Ade02nite_17460 [Paractinoplanes deccanensis]|uniref:Peptidase S58 family protein n=1 Tax=Paractinoplanes deccanensis TaxID=113561 RepID=A0ABQ3XZD9_9ACTN|nr:P1 family peptidase [Actinoplanes deccanensis]GID73105.1 hypothetical protein Ade02nite_17460 [Actinoplanes deccanensis]